MKNAIQLYLKLLQFPNNKEITVTTINEQYRAIIDKENLLDKTRQSEERLSQIRDAKLFLIENIDAVTKLMLDALIGNANELFVKKKYREALITYEEISKYETWGADISSLISADDCIRYGICCLLEGLRITESRCYLFAYGYGGRWVDENWVDCKDYAAFPTEWADVKKNIENMVSEHPLIREGISKGCSRALFDLYISTESDILAKAKTEFFAQESLKRKILSNPKLLKQYIGKHQGFFLYKNRLYYIYDDGNDNLYPIYKVDVIDENLVMTFCKFSHFRKKHSGKVQKRREYTIKLITETFLQLDCAKGNVPCGQCQIGSGLPRIKYENYMQKPRFGQCSVCGGKTLLGLCFNFCWTHIDR